MSWRGVKKSISRLPHQFKTRNGGDEVTRDTEYLAWENQFNKVVGDAEEIRIEAMVYRDSVSSVLTFQTQCATTLAEAYGLSAQEDDDSGYDQDIPAHTRQALLDYATAMDYCRHEILSQLDDLDHFVVRPLTQLRDIVRTIQKSITKRQHKLIDYDRFRVTYYKLSAIPEPTPSEEKTIFKLQSQFDNAAHEYEYFNKLLKDEFVQFLDLCQDLIEPVIQQFYNIQCKVVGGIYGRLHEVIQHNAFPTIEAGIEEGYEMRLAEYNAREVLENTDLLKKGSAKPWERRGSRSPRDHRPSPYSQQDDNDTDYLSAGYQMQRTPSDHSMTGSFRSKRSASFTTDRKPPLLSPKPTYARTHSATFSNQPLLQENTPSPRNTETAYIKVTYSSDDDDSSRYSSAVESPVCQNTISSEVKKKRTPPPPPPSRTKKEYVEALYDLDAQQEGDLSFRYGDRIEVLEKSETTADWWKGKIGGKTGMFPANYVRII
ncbi:BAR-domain-containing protein [Backusella circina FSU 941]|nr:BAR-domain-containing protein [Backusella circina FSU 941]